MNAAILCFAVFYKVENVWTIAHLGRTPSNLFRPLPPVRVVPGADAVGLATALKEVVMAPKGNAPELTPDDWHNAGPEAEAVGIKSRAEFVRKSRCFKVRADDDSLEVSELVPHGKQFRGPASWTRRFSPPDFDAVAVFLTKDQPT